MSTVVRARGAGARPAGAPVLALAGAALDRRCSRARGSHAHAARGAWLAEVREALDCLPVDPLVGRRRRRGSGGRPVGAGAEVGEAGDRLHVEETGRVHLRPFFGESISASIDCNPRRSASLAMCPRLP